jgi:hypothetical protein
MQNEIIGICDIFVCSKLSILDIIKILFVFTIITLIFLGVLMFMPDDGINN